MAPERIIWRQTWGMSPMSPSLSLGRRNRPFGRGHVLWLVQRPAGGGPNQGRRSPMRWVGVEASPPLLPAPQCRDAGGGDRKGLVGEDFLAKKAWPKRGAQSP